MQLWSLQAPVNIQPVPTHLACCLLGKAYEVHGLHEYVGVLCLRAQSVLENPARAVPKTCAWLLDGPAHSACAKSYGFVLYATAYLL